MVSNSSDGSDPAIDALWKHVLDHWDDDRAHGAFLDACQRADRLVEAAVRYRGMAADRERGPRAQRRLAAVTALALAKLESSRTAPSPHRPAYAGILMIVIFVVGTIVLLAYLNGYL